MQRYLDFRPPRAKQPQKICSYFQRPLYQLALIWGKFSLNLDSALPQLIKLIKKIIFSYFECNQPPTATDWHKQSTIFHHPQTVPCFPPSPLAKSHLNPFTTEGCVCGIHTQNGYHQLQCLFALQTCVDFKDIQYVIIL